MSITYGITDAGFVRKTLEIIKAEREESVRQTFGTSIDLAPEGPIGQWIGVESEREALLWELAEAAYNSLNPDSAEGAAQDSVAAITGTLRTPAQPSLVTLALTGTPTTPLDAGRIASVSITEKRFTTLVATVIPAALTARATSTAYVIGDRRTNNGHAWICTIAGTSSAGTGPQTATAAAPTVVDGTVSWYWLGLGTGAIDVAAASEESAAIVGSTGTIRTIETPVSGWSGVVNLADAILGNEIEGHAALRIRREQELVANGGGLVESIRNALLDTTNVPGVLGVRVFQNSDYQVNGDGMPPNSIEAVVRGGTDADIRATLWAFGASAGIYSHGSVSGTITDSQGHVQTVRFSRPTEVPIYIVMTVERNTLTYPLDGDTQIRTSILARGNADDAFGINARPHMVRSQAFLVDGVLDVPVCNVGTAPAPVTEASIAIGLREIAVYDSARIAITLTSGTP